MLLEYGDMQVTNHTYVLPCKWRLLLYDVVVIALTPPV